MSNSAETIVQPAAGTSRETFKRDLGLAPDIPLLRSADEELRAAVAAVEPTQAPEAGLTARMNQLLTSGSDEIREQFAATSDAALVHRERARLVDLVLQGALDFADDHLFQRSTLTTGEALAVVALGGYGRAELAPGSDIDLLFLYPYKLTPRTEQTAEFLLYRLWDLKLKIGQSVRSVHDCIKLSRNDLQIETSLLEARLIWGSRDVFAELQNSYQAEIKAKRGPEFIEAKLAERDARHDRMGNSRYLLEPNIKEGKGGLRDLHTLAWLGKYLYGIRAIDDLTEHTVLTAQAAHTFERAKRFLWTVRCHLHYLTGRAEERLTFDLQPKVAEAMGYRDRGRIRGVERFMKHYYLTAKDVGDLTRIFCAALEERHQRKPSIVLPRFGFGKRRQDGFLIQRGRISPDDPTLFKNRPIKILELFSQAQARDLDIHPEALRLIAETRGQAYRTLLEDPEASRLFLSMLTSPKDPAETLKRLNEAGVLGRFIPDFGRVVAQMQHNLYHIYTVDEHTIRVIDNLHRFETGALGEEMPLAVELFPQLASRRELFVAAFIHDLGKGRDRSHSLVGEEIAQRLCPRFGMSEGETETVAWLVREHLLMSDFAFKRDTEDPQTVADFVKRVQSPERLRLLTVLTMADIRAVGPGVWNGWKGQLLRELYREAHAAMNLGDPRGRRAERLAGVKERLRDALVAAWSCPAEDASRYIERHDGRYLLSFPLSELVRHAEVIRGTEARMPPLAMDFHADASQDRTELMLYTADHPGLFMKAAGALAMSGVSIVHARIFTTSDLMAVDFFGIQDTASHAVELSGGREARITRNIEKALRGEVSLERALHGKRSLPERANVFKVEPRVIIDNNASDTHTLVEVNGRDRPGLLFALASTFMEMRLIITSAHISTFGEQVVDVFYVKDVFGLKIMQRGHQQRIISALKKALSEE